MSIIKAIPAELMSQVQEVAADINIALTHLRDDERTLDTGYARLAALLARFNQLEGWRDLQFDSIGQYLRSLEQKYNRSSSQLWAYLEVGKWLLEPVGEDGLNKMGISKAFEIVRATKQSKKTEVDPQLIALAMDDKVTLSKIRAAAYQIYNVPEDSQLTPGTYYDFGGFYVDQTEREEIKEFYEIAAILFGADANTPKWKVHKQGVMAAIREFNGTHAAEAYGPPELGDGERVG